MPINPKKLDKALKSIKKLKLAKVLQADARERAAAEKKQKEEMWGKTTIVDKWEQC